MFRDCTGLTSITIPNNITEIGDDAFQDCTGLTTVTFHCKEIGSWFRYNQSIKNVVIGNEVTRIGYNAFNGCKSLTTITIPSNVTSIGNCAFYDCNLSTVNVPNTVKELGHLCFADNKSLKSATVPAHIKPGALEIFADCPNLKAVSVRSGNKTKRSTDVAWFKDQTARPAPSAPSTPSIDPNSMSWPGPVFDSGWEYKGTSSGTAHWNRGMRCDGSNEVMILDMYKNAYSGKVSFITVHFVGSYSNVKDAEAAAYFYSVHGL
jgi:hypothetical protein